MEEDEILRSIIADPELTDPSIDVSRLRKTTPTRAELLADVPEFSGLKFDPTQASYLEDLYRVYSGQIPMVEETPAAVTPVADTGVGESGGGGQATLPTDDFNRQEFEQNLIDQGVGLQIAPDQPVIAPGEVPVTNLDLAIYNDPMLGVVDVDGEGEFGGLDEGADPDRIQANEFADIESPTGIGPTYDEAGLPDTSIPDRGRGEIPTSTDEFDVTTDQFTRPTMADIAGPVVPIDPTQTMLDVPSTEVLGIGFDPEFDKSAIVDGQELKGTSPFTLGNVYTGEFDPDDEGTVFDTSITPKDTEKSITQKVANYLGVDTSKINKAAVTGALNLVAGKALNTVIPVFTVIDLVKDAFVKSPEEEAVPTTTGVNPFKDIDTGVGEFDTTPAKQLTSTDLPYDTEFEDMADVENIGLSSRADINTTDKFIVPFEGARTVIENPNYIEPGGTILEDDFEFDSVPADTSVDEFSDEAFMVGDTSTAAPTTGGSGVDSFFDSVDTITGGGGGRDRDPDPAPSFDPGQGFVDTGGGGEFETGPVSTKGQAGPPSQRGGGGDSGGGGGGGGGCVIATHAVNSGAFTVDTKREAIRWCVKNLHKTWWGEAIRRGYRYYGQKAIEEGKAKNHYQEFKDYVAFGTGKRRTLKTGWTFVYRSIQFFIRGLING